MHSIHETGTKVNGAQVDPGKDLRQLTDDDWRILLGIRPEEQFTDDDWRISWALEGFDIGTYEPELAPTQFQTEHCRRTIRKEAPSSNS